MKKLLLIICIALLSVGCNDNYKVEKGYIVGMRYVPRNNRLQYNVCLKIFTTTIIPEKHFIWIADSVDVRKIKVDKSTYSKVKVGSYYDLKDAKK